MDDFITIKTEDGGESKLIIGAFEDNVKYLLPTDTHVIIVTDANVHRIYKEFIDRYDHIIIGQGESIKTLVTVEAIYRGLLEKNADRSSFILGVGGGIVTDITGFAASTFMRGVRFGFISTTLLGQVDASVGGKTGVNLDGYKNIVGTFYQPEFVICDPAMLSTLPAREFRAGIAEVIKAGIIGDPELFEIIERHTFQELRTDKDLLKQIIERSIKVKIDIVEADERERDCRRLLNLGHTFGHAFEKGVQNIMHGEAVGAGIAIISEVAESQGLLSGQDGIRIREVIDSVGLPTEYPVETKKLVKLIKHDKKREGNSIYMVFPRTIGRCEVKLMSFEQVEAIFSEIQPRRVQVEENTAVI